MWEHENKMFLSVEVDGESVLGLIAKAQSQMEELKSTLADLKRTISVKEKTADLEKPTD